MTKRISYKEKYNEDSASFSLDLLHYLGITNISGSCFSADQEFVFP